MFTNMWPLLISFTFTSASSVNTCYKSDTTILGSGNVTISNVLRCASKAGNSSGSITTCMEETYPSYGTVTEFCLDCITEVMQSSIGEECLPACIQDLSSASCIACSPALVDEWSGACDQGLTIPDDSSGRDGSADSPVVPVCSEQDKSLIQAGMLFVVPSLYCLKDLSTFESCLGDTVPYYNEISVGCKACASAMSTPSGIQAEECGATCMQQPVNAGECATCALQLASSFDTNCLSKEATSFLGRTLFAVILMIAAAIN